MQEYETFFVDLIDADKRTFNLFKFSEKVGRDKTLPLLTVHLILQHHLDVFINDRKFALFLNEIFRGYRRDV